MTAPVQKPSALKVILPILGILTLVVIGLNLVKSQMKSPAGHVDVVQGQSLGDVSLDRLEGGKVSLSEMSGKIFLINFWASWCEACMVEMPSIVQLRKDFHSQGFEVLTINVDENPQAVVPRLAKKLGMDFPLFIDLENRLADLFDVHAIPMTAIVDKTGKVLLIETGERDWNSDEVRTMVANWLKGT